VTGRTDRPGRMSLTDLTRIVLAAELSTRSQFRNMGSDNPQLMEIANSWMYQREGHMMRASVDDAQVIAHRVFYDVQDIMMQLIRPLCDSSIKDEHLKLMIARVFYDDSPRYTPVWERKSPRG
jgi:hypothetical protein